MISKPDLERSPLSLLDDVGTVFFAPGRVFRAIFHQSVSSMESLLHSGLLDELMDKELIPRTWRSTVSIPGYPLVLEHERLPIVSYPYEWSYGMLQDAAVLVLEINQIARGYGWELKDTHGFNVLFKGSRPLYVDIGSFVRIEGDPNGWPALEEFVRRYQYPLCIWRTGGGFIARRLVAATEPMSHSDFGLYRWPCLRWFGAALYQRICTRWYQLRRISRVPKERIAARLPKLSRSVCWLTTRGWLPWQTIHFNSMRRNLIRHQRSGGGGFWSGYQNAGPMFVATPRFRRLMEILRQFGIESIIELAGNQGQFATELLARKIVKTAINTDADELAIDRSYQRNKAVGGSLISAVLDFVHPMVNPFGEHPAARFKAQGALALAVTHHLLLTHGIPIEFLLKRIAMYSYSMVFIEFMPLGLWDGHSSKPVPSWYNIDWFRLAFQSEYELVHDEPLETNRHLFCGRIRSQSLKNGQS